MQDEIQVKCNRCEGPLIQISRVEEKIANFQSLVTITKYICSNETCQKEADEKMKQFVARREEQKNAKLLRLSQKN